MGVSAFLAWYMVPRLLKWAQEYDDMWYIAVVFGCIGVVVCFIIAIANIYASIGELLNAPYWAFSHLTSDLKGLF